jgi:hypothetical protein
VYSVVSWATSTVQNRPVLSLWMEWFSGSVIAQ